MVLLSFFFAAQKSRATRDESEKNSESNDKKIQKGDIPDNKIFLKDCLDDCFALSNGDYAVFNGGE